MVRDYHPMTRPALPCPLASASVFCLGLLLAACGDGGAPASGPAPSPSETPGQGSPPRESPAPTPAEPSDQPGAPGDRLPLTPGVYVATGENCAQPANAGFRIYNGQGLSGSATRECRAAVRSRDGDVYQVDQSCVDTYSGQRTTVAQTIRAPNAQSFTLTEAGGSATSFRLCPPGEAPSHLQDMVTP